MKDFTFVTGNQNKVDYLSKFFGVPVKHIKLDLDEIQSLDLKIIAEHKARQAYQKVQTPVLVEDSSLEFYAFGKLPGPFIRFFVEEMSLEAMCLMLPENSRKAVARSTFGYFDGKDMRFFEGILNGEIAMTPKGENGWAWDKIFIPEGYSVTRGELNDEEYKKTSLIFRSVAELKEFLE